MKIRTPKRKDPRKFKRPNPAATLPMGEAMRDMSANLMVLAALDDWTRDERLLLAALLPKLRATFKQIAPDQLAGLVQGPQITVDVTAKVPPLTPGGRRAFDAIADRERKLKK